MKRHKNTLSRNQQGMIGDFFIVTAMFVAIGFAGYMIYSANKSPSEVKSGTSESVEEVVVEHPELYKRYNLPEYSKAEVAYISEPADSIETGLNITLKTVDSVNTVGKFYADSFAKLGGWSYTPPRASSQTLYVAEAVNQADNLVYGLTISKFPDGTNIRISLIQGDSQTR
jgi:hypothetical protein